MKRILFLVSIFCVLKTNAQNYLISFEGTGSSTTVSTVKVENLTKGTTLIINGNDILRLTIVTGFNSIEDNQSSELKIYPNPMNVNATLEIFPPVEGNAIISIYDMNGIPLAQIPTYLENSRQEFRLSGLENGFYLISVKGRNYHLSGRAISNVKSKRTISIEKVSRNIQPDEKEEITGNKGPLATIDMEYTSGDRLKFTGISGDYSTIITDNPISDKAISFNFIACKDGDNNFYPVVGIGDQVWMAENLKTTKYKDGTTTIPLVTGNTEWSQLVGPGYCWYNNNEAEFKTFYGALYNWYTISGGNLCPSGWHIPTSNEWISLKDYLINSGYPYPGKSLASTSGWTTFATPGTIGIDQMSNNITGFTALPGGARHFDDGRYMGILESGSYWSTTEQNVNDAWNVGLSYGNGDVALMYQSKKVGFSARCVKDN